MFSSQGQSLSLLKPFKPWNNEWVCACTENLHIEDILQKARENQEAILGSLSPSIHHCHHSVTVGNLVINKAGWYTATSAADLTRFASTRGGYALSPLFRNFAASLMFMGVDF